MPAAHVGHFGPGGQLGLDSLQGRNPVRHQILAVAGEGGGRSDFGGGEDFGGGGGSSRPQQRPQPAAFDTDLDDDVPF